MRLRLAQGHLLIVGHCWPAEKYLPFHVVCAALPTSTLLGCINNSRLMKPQPALLMRMAVMENRLEHH